MKRLLILFTNGFPYNNSEPFLEQEYPLYREYFDKVLISAACTRGEKPTRKLENDTTEVLSNYTLSRDLRSVLTAIPYLLVDRKYYKELFQLCKAGKLIPGRFYEITVTALCGNQRAYQVEKWLKSHPGYDQIVLYSYWMTIPAYGALKLKELLKNKSIRVVTRCHGYDVYSERSKPKYLPFQEENVRHLDVIAPVSRNGMTYLNKKYNGLSNIRPQHLGVVNTVARNPNAVRAPVRIVSCARVIPLKRLTRIVDALALLEKIEVQWIHIGDGEGLKDLMSYAQRKLSGKKNIQFEFLGAIPNTQVYELYQNEPFHVFLNVSETEGIPVSIMEAMSFGILVIATDVGGTSELVTDGENGYLLDRDYTDEVLVSRIETIANLPEEDYRQMRVHANMTIQTQFDATTNYRNFIEEVLL